MYKRLIFLITLILMLSFNFAALTDNLSHYYNFDETSGDLLDQVGSLDGSNNLVTQEVSGIINEAYNYDSVSAKTTFTQSSTTTSELSVAVWVKYTDQNQNPEFYTQGNNDSDIFSIWSWDIGTAEGITCKVKTAYNTGLSVGNMSYADGQWHLIICTYDGANTRLWVDDTYYGSLAQTGTISNYNPYIGPIGAYNKSRTQDEMGIWDTNLSDSQITELYNDGDGLIYPFIAKRVNANFNYVIDKPNSQIIFTDTSTSNNTTINDWNWTINNVLESTDQNFNYATTALTDINACLTIDNNDDTLTDSKCVQFNIGDWTAPTTTLTDNGQTAGTANYSLDLNCTDNNIGCEYINFSIDGGDYNYYLIGDNPLNIIVTGGGDHNIAYFSSDFNDNNEAVNNYDFTTYGAGQISFYDETNSDLNEITYSITPSINGVTSGITTLNSLDFNFQGITSGTYTFTFSKTGYTTKNFNLDLNEYSKIDYNFVFIAVDDTSSVDFQVFNLSGTTQKNTKFFAFDFDLNKYVDIKTTDSLGRMTMKLNETKSDYNFFSSAFNFGTTTWTIAKPKDAITLVDITGNWKYSITGASYSSETNIVAGVQKLLLQNTVNPYYIQIQDEAETYAPSNFGLQSITTENDKNLNPYLYLYSQADLKLIKLLRYSTNIPISEPYELDLSVYTDSNGLIPIGTFINDSTGTYNIYMDSNAHYRLEIGSETFELSPTLGVYYVYLSQDIGIEINNTILDTNDSFTDSNLPNIFLEVREFAFGCSITETNCYESATFSIIAIILLTIIFIALIPSSPLQQTIITASLLSLFTAISFIPLWLFGITIVIIIAWGIFS